MVYPLAPVTVTAVTDPFTMVATADEYVPDPPVSVTVGADV